MTTNNARRLEFIIQQRKQLFFTSRGCLDACRHSPQLRFGGTILVVEKIGATDCNENIIKNLFFILMTVFIFLVTQTVARNIVVITQDMCENIVLPFVIQNKYNKKLQVNYLLRQKNERETIEVSYKFTTNLCVKTKKLYERKTIRDFRNLVD